MKKVSLYCFALILITLIAFCNIAHAQTAKDIQLNESFQNRSLKEFFTLLQDKYKVKVFYKESWIKEYTITENFKNISLGQALNGVFQEHELTYDFFQDDAIVIFKRSSDTRSNFDNENHILVIGDPLNIGRYKVANLNGKVLDGKTGEPLVGAVVYNSKLAKGVTTNEKGEFELELPTGDHQFNLSFIGFQNTSTKIKLIETGFCEFNIFEETHNIDEITVLGEGSDLPRSQMSMVKLTSAELEELPALMGEVDVLKSIAMQAGVQTVGELSSGFNVRGGNTDQNLILIEGTPVFNTSHLFGFLSLINPDVVKDVRLFKGGMPVRFGERVASVMEVDFKDGNDKSIYVNGGIGLINSRLSIDGPLTKNKKLTFITGGRSSYSNWILQRMPDVTLSNSVANFYDLSGKVTYKFDKYNKVAAMGYVSHDRFSTSSESVTEYGNKLGNLSLNTRLAETMNGEMLVAYSEYDYRLENKASGKRLESYYLDNKFTYASVGYNIKWHPFPRHNIDLGTKYVINEISPGEISPAYEETIVEEQSLNLENTREWAIYLGEDYEVLPQLSLMAGIRYSHFNNIGTPVVYLYDPNKPKDPENVIDSLTFGTNESSASYSGIEPRLSFSYDFDLNTTLKVGYQRTRQNVFQLSNNAVATPAETWKAADYHLDPLISDQVAIGIENDSWVQGLDLAGEVYYKKLQNLIEYKNGAQLLMNEHIETALIPTSGYSYGLELSVKKSLGRLTGAGSYVYSRTMRKTESEFDEENLWNGEYYPSIYDKPHDFSLNATYKISRRWRMSGNFVFISGRPVTLPELKYEYADEQLIYYSERNKYRMPPYHRFDVSITLDENLRKKRSWKGSWTLSVYNLYGRHNPYSVYYRKSVSGRQSSHTSYSLYKLSVIGIPVPSLTYNFKF